MTTPEKRLSDLGLVLPGVVAPAGVYVPAMRTGNLLYTAGQVPIVDGKPAATGKLGAEIDLEHGQRLAQICALNGIAALKSEVGDLTRIKRIVKVVAFVASAPDFYDQPKVANGASELLGKVFGDAGKHARSAVGVSVLPLNLPVEVELIAEVA